MRSFRRKLSYWCLALAVCSVCLAMSIVLAVYAKWTIMWLLGAVPSPGPPLGLVIWSAKLGAVIGAFIAVSILLLEHYDDWQNGLKVSRTLRRGKWKGHDSNKASPPPGPRPGGR